MKHQPISDFDKAQLLQKWAEYGAAIGISKRKRHPSWEPAERMVPLAQQKLAKDAERLRTLLEESRRLLQPLDDPFMLDLGLNRWLSADREESYSDWLQWIVEQLRSPELVTRLFGSDICSEFLASCEGLSPTVYRELRVASGHVDREGRLDLVVRYADKILLVVELKVTSADDADTAKHEGYINWMKKQTVAHSDAIILALDSRESMYCGFRLCTWTDVCIRLRHVARRLSKQNRISTAALVLAFVSAVEQNLLGFSAALVQKICDRQLVLFNAKVVNCVAKCLHEET